jgi:hypothetical protein
MRYLISYAIGFISAAMILSAVGMVNSLVHLDTDGCVIWGISLIVESVLLNVAMDRL